MRGKAAENREGRVAEQNYLDEPPQAPDVQAWFQSTSNVEAEMVKVTRKPCELFLTRNQVVEILGVSPPTLTRWAMERKGPPYVKLDDAPRSRVLYPRAEFEAWVQERTVHPKK
jgi:predicted DNA-binding transcriptional regulator AlpA